MFHLFRRNRFVPSSRKVPFRRQPLLEVLEDRSLPSAVITVTTNLDPSGPSGTISLRQAITTADGTTGDTIKFASSLSGQTIVLSAGQLSITKSMTIQGLGSSHLTVEGTDRSRAFYINGGGTAADVTISGLKITHDSGTVSGDGGGILVEGSSDSLTLMNSFVGGPLVGTGINSFDSGGGIASDTGSGGSLKIQGSTISGNSCDDDNGGGVYVENGTTTIINSTIKNNDDTFAGGGIFQEDGTLSVTGSTISGNTIGGEGAGIYFRGSSLTVTNSTISGNTAHLNGGGIADYGRSSYLHIKNSTISGNHSVGNNMGGGVDFEGSTFLIEGSTIDNNTVGNRDGGGLYLNGAGTIRDTTIAGNTSGGEGGGVWFSGGEGGGPLVIERSTISGNTAEGNNFRVGGGGIKVNYGDLTLINSTISGNTAVSTSTRYGGGGIYFDGRFIDSRDIARYAELTVTNCTIAFNKVTPSSSSGGGEGGGVFLEEGTATLHNTIVADNHVAGVADDLYRFLDLTTKFNASYDLIQTDSNQINGTNQHNLFGIDPKLGPLQNNGGPTATLALLAGSPAIDAGSNALAVNPPGGPPTADTGPLTTDQRGPGFPRIINGIVDIGAFEFQLPPVLLNRRWNR